MSEQLESLLSRYADDMTEGLVVPRPPEVHPAPRRAVPRLNALLPVAAAAAAVLAVVAIAAAVADGAKPAPVVEVTAAGPPMPLGAGDTPPPPPEAVGLPPMGSMDGPDTPAPPGREALKVSLELPDEPVVDEQTPYTVELVNERDEAVSLSPCPGYRMSYGGQGTAGRLPCEELPEQVAPGQTVRVTLSAQFGFWDGPDADPRRKIDVAWAIRGPEPATGTTTLTYPPLPEPVAVAPFVDTPAPAGEPMSGQEGSSRGITPWWPIKPTIIDAPAQVRAGEQLRYTVRMWNDNPTDAVSLTPCRGFTQWLQRPVQPAGETVAFLDWSFERGEVGSLLSSEHSLNCAALPAELPARQWVQLEMRLSVPADYPPGDASLAWKVGELDVFGSPQTRYVTVRVLPAG
jgi:hypothetical protein